MVGNSDSTSHGIISCLGPEKFVQIKRILIKFCHRKLGILVIMTHRVDPPWEGGNFKGKEAPIAKCKNG